MSAWEYMTVTENSLSQLAASEGQASTTGVLNMLGTNEWELVAVDNQMLYFKRPLVPHADRTLR